MLSQNESESNVIGSCTYHPFTLKHSSTQYQYPNAKPVLNNITPYAGMVHGGLKRTRSSVKNTAGARWNPISVPNGNTISS